MCVKISSTVPIRNSEADILAAVVFNLSTILQYPDMSVMPVFTVSRSVTPPTATTK